MASNILNHIGIENYIFLSVILFCIGVFGVLYRRNAIIVFMSIEIMLKIHDTGIGLAGTYPREIAELKQEQTESAARTQKFPLQVTIEADE